MAKKRYYSVYRIDENGKADNCMKHFDTVSDAESYIKEIKDFLRYTILKTFK